MSIPYQIPTLLRWGLGLLLPGFFCLLVALFALLAEANTDWGARRLGSWLLQHNDQRLLAGTTWQNISAQRRARTLLDSAAREPQIDAKKLPLHLLTHHYAQLQRTPHFARWRSHKRTTALSPQDLSPQQLRLLAQSMQAFAQVDDLLAHIELPVDGFQIQARIYAQTALEDGSLFPELHRRLLQSRAPEAWNFTRMDIDDRRAWQEKLRPLLSAQSERKALPEAPAIGETLTALVAAWSDSLQRDEIERLRRSWRQATDFELRLVRNLDEFAGYALLAGELPVRFIVPAVLGAKAVDSAQLGSQ
jgi:hypothetical protein